jgi:hypothetical protein
MYNTHHISDGREFRISAQSGKSHSENKGFPKGLKSSPWSDLLHSLTQSDWSLLRRSGLVLGTVISQGGKTCCDLCVFLLSLTIENFILTK